MESLKQRLKAGETVNGCWLNLGSPLTAEIVALSGFDWVLIDLEHGAGTEANLVSQLQAVQGTGTTSIVRVESGAHSRISRVMDMGAAGIMCPKVNTGEDAKRIIDALHYPPFGSRGVAKMVRASQFGHNFNAYYEGSRDNVLAVLQIETLEAFNHLDAIAATEGVDVLFIGPADLTMALGIFGQFEHPTYIDAVKKIVAAAEKAGKATGVLFFNTAEYEKYHGLGIRFIACGSDGAFITDSARNMANKINDLRTNLQK